MKDVTIVIPSWNGKEILKKSLPLVLEICPKSKVIVIDDGSTDSTMDFLKKFPDIVAVHNDQNLGFTKSVNKALALVTTEYICLLNNDVYPVEGFLDKSKRLLDDNNELVAVTFNEENSSWPFVEWKDGKLSFTQGKKDGFDHYCMWPSGGSCLMRTEYIKTLGGFREVFSPGYFEDIELGFRIWRSGGKVVWSKDSKVIHRHETSFSKLNPDFVSNLKQSNELVFTWLTFDEDRYLIDHVKFLVTYTLTHPGYLKIILMALYKYLMVKPQKYKQTTPLKEALITANKRYE